MRTALVFAGGPHRFVEGAEMPWVGTDAEAVVARPDLVVAADSGLHAAQALGIAVDLVVGDLDSVDPAELAAAQRTGTRVDRHPTDKDATDLELALDQLIGHRIDAAVLVGADGGRMDHLFGAVLSLCAPRYSAIRFDAWLGAARVLPVWDARTVRGTPGRHLSLLPVHGPARVHVTGVRWPLHGEVLEVGSSRGVSNEWAADDAVVTVEDGCVAVVVPEEVPE